MTSPLSGPCNLSEDVRQRPKHQTNSPPASGNVRMESPALAPRMAPAACGVGLIGLAKPNPATAVPGKRHMNLHPGRPQLPAASEGSTLCVDAGLQPIHDSG